MLQPNYSQQYFIQQPIINSNNYSKTQLYLPNNNQISYIPNRQQISYTPNNQQVSYVLNNQQILYPQIKQQIIYVPNNQEIYPQNNQQVSYILNNQQILYPQNNQQVSYILNNQQILYPQDSQQVSYQKNIPEISNSQDNKQVQNNQEILPQETPYVPNSQETTNTQNNEQVQNNQETSNTQSNEQVQNSQEISNPQNNQGIPYVPNNQEIIYTPNNQQISYVPNIQQILNQQSSTPIDTQNLNTPLNNKNISPFELSDTQNIQTKKNSKKKKNINTYIKPIGSRIPIEKNHYQIFFNKKNENNSNAENNSNNDEESESSESSESHESHESHESPENNEKNKSHSSKKRKKNLIVPGTHYEISHYTDVLRNNLENIGTDEDLIITIIENTKLKERELIRKYYKQKYNEDLIKKFQKELNGDLKESVIGSFMNPIEYDSFWIYNSLKLLGKKVGALTEIIGSRTSSELQRIKKFYSNKYGETLKNEIDSETYGDYRKLLLALLQCKRSNSSNPDTSACANDASDLYKLGIKKRENDNETFIRIFTTSSPLEISIINHFYKQQSGKGLLGAIESEFEFSGETRNLLSTIVMAQIDPYGFYAKIIYDSLENISTNNNTKLIRNICARYSVDLPLIKKAYFRDYESELLKDIQTKIPGNFGKILYSLVYKEK